jgi:hypothetical protein
VDDKLAVPLALASLAGFAIQQAVQILDPCIMAFVAWCKSRRTSKDLPGGMTDADFKKAVIAALSFGMGALVTYFSHIRLLVLLGEKYGGAVDFVVTALVVGAGTQAANSLQKFAEYAKDAMKPKPAVTVTVTPASAALAPGATIQFRAVVTNTENREVLWEVLHGEGGTIDQTGRYTAPATPGAYAICVTSRADPTKSAIAGVTVAKPAGV